MKTRILFVSIVAILGSLLTGCSTTGIGQVKPWERATLAGYSMRADRDGLHTVMNEHTFFSREGSTGGRGVGGSGCGCN